MSMREEITQAKYEADRADKKLVDLKEVPAINDGWIYWRLIDNTYPHDRHHTRHHLLILKKGGIGHQFWNLSMPELKELQDILRNLNGQYDTVKYNFPAMQSVPGVFHIHLLNLKEEYK